MYTFTKELMGVLVKNELKLIMLNRPYPVNIYLFKVNNKNTRLKGVKYFNGINFRGD